jgi:thiosulfate reductase cytochrome b subunit
MDEIAITLKPAIRGTDTLHSPRHSAVVRITHWITAFCFLALVVSGVAILLAHPRLYWGETGSVETPSLVDLPLPFVLVGQSGWGRSLHFVSAWASVLTGFFYVLSGLLTQHFRRDLLPVTGDLAWEPLSRTVLNHLQFKRPAEDEFQTYNIVQQLVYLAVIFILFPLIVATGLAMSPAITSVAPALVNVFGGYESARTVHFFLASSLVIFLAVHIAMVCITGFASRMRAMITGDRLGGKVET